MEIEPLRLIKILADDDGDVVNDASKVMFVRQGEEVVLEIKRTPGAGYTVIVGNNMLPFSNYVQKEILHLPRLATQIIRSMQKRLDDKTKYYIDGPSSYQEDTNQLLWKNTSEEVRNTLLQPRAFSTQLIELMAGAGQGKTVLLEKVALDLAKMYQPDTSPIPLLLPVDLLGRYIGTIDDAIAGTLNNTIFFPLSQKDIILCMEQGWITLALDGFDELVARIGARDAFIKVNELVDQLNNSGTIIISARENFFLLHNISESIQSYLKPKVGGYITSSLKLLPWEKEQAISVFKNAGSDKPGQDYNLLADEFSSDISLLSNPFFLTKIVDLWFKGDKFTEFKGIVDQQFRIKYIIEQYILRESKDKWKTTKEEQILTTEQHNIILGAIAEVMWTSYSFKITLEELNLSTELALLNLGIEKELKDSIIARIPTHAALKSSDNFFSFIHEQFFSFYFGYQLSKTVLQNEFDNLQKLIYDKELPDSVLKWYAYCMQGKISDLKQVLTHFEKIKMLSQEYVFQINISSLILPLLNNFDLAERIQLENYIFYANMFQGLKIKKCYFKSCKFVDVSLESVEIIDCTFDDCSFEGLSIKTKNSKLSNNNLINNLPTILYVDEDGYYDPEVVLLKLKELDFVVTSSQLFESKFRYIKRDVIQSVVRIVRWSNRFFNIDEKEIIPKCPDYGDEIIKIGIDTGAFKRVEFDVSGPKKKFFRIIVDRDQLLQGQSKRVDDDRVNKFWEILEKKFPDK